MTKTLRNQSDVWNSVDDKRPQDVGIRQWKRSYQGVYQVLLSIGLILQTTPEEFEKLEIPLRSNGTRQYMWRKVAVMRNGVISQPIRIDSLITGNNELLDINEKIAYQMEHSIKKSLANPKGVLTTHNLEKNAIDQLDSLLKIYTYRSHLWEHRLADIAYSADGVSWAADQVKTAKMDSGGKCGFNSETTSMQVGYMIKVLEQKFSLTCIGKNNNQKIKVVWYFQGSQSIEMLKQFNEKQYFSPVLIPKKLSSNRFTQAYSQPQFRYDLNNNCDIERLGLAKLRHIQLNSKYTLKFLNEDFSQIPGPSHRVEQISFEMTRDACESIGVEVAKHLDDSYGSVDFRIGKCKVQDKVASNYQCGMRVHEGRYPYDPDKIDIFQVSFLKEHVIYAIPMRVFKNNQVISHFTEIDLMKMSINIGPNWKKSNLIYRYDLKNTEQINRYVEACRNATDIPKLTDTNFYQSILTENRNKFGSVKNLQSRRIEIEKPIKILRKISDVWKGIGHLKPIDQKPVIWKRSYQCIKSAIEYIGFKLEMSQEDFESLKIPFDSSGCRHYLGRKIIVSRNGVISKPIKIEGLLEGKTRLLTSGERSNQYRDTN